MRTSRAPKQMGERESEMERFNNRAGDANDHKNKRCELPSTWEKYQQEEVEEEQFSKVGEEFKGGSISICFIS